MKEYILLVAQFDKQIENTTKNVASGLIKEINIDSMVDQRNPLLKTVPQPAKPDDSEYLEGLAGRDKEIFELFESISETKNENELIQLVKDGKVGPKE